MGTSTPLLRTQSEAGGSAHEGDVCRATLGFSNLKLLGSYIFFPGGWAMTVPAPRKSGMDSPPYFCLLGPSLEFLLLSLLLCLVPYKVPVVLWRCLSPFKFALSTNLFIFAASCNMWDLGSLTTDWTRVPCSGSTESQLWTAREVPLSTSVNLSLLGTFSGDPVSKISHSQCRGPGFHPWLRN